MNARKSLSFTWLLAALVWGGLLAEQSAAQKTPMPPRTGTFSVQMFQGNTQFCWIAIWPPSTYTDGTPIPPGTPVQIKAYPSYNRGKTYGTRGVSTVSGGRGFVDQGEKDARKKRWIDSKLKTPVTHTKPFAVWLAASAVVGGKESRMVNSNLTFRYVGKDGRPRLVRYPTPDIDGVGMDDELARPLPQELPGKWTNGQFIMTRLWVDKTSAGKVEGCNQVIINEINKKLNKPMSMVMTIIEIDLVGAPGLGNNPINPLKTRKIHFPGTLSMLIRDPKATTPSQQSQRMGFMYNYRDRSSRMEKTQKNMVMRMGGQFFQNATHYTIRGTWKMTLTDKGKDAGWVRGTWNVSKRKP